MVLQTPLEGLLPPKALEHKNKHRSQMLSNNAQGRKTLVLAGRVPQAVTPCVVCALSTDATNVCFVVFFGRRQPYSVDTGKSRLCESILEYTEVHTTSLQWWR